MAVSEQGETRPRRKMIDGGFVVLIVLAVGSGLGVYFQDGAAQVLKILGRDALFALLLLPKIAGGVLVASTLPLLLPRDRVLTLIGPESGVRGLMVATLAGAAVPGGPSVTLPLVGGLMAAGADLGAGLAMVTGWVLLSLNRTLIWELSFLPADVVLYRVAISLAAPVFVGLAARALLR